MNEKEYVLEIFKYYDLKYEVEKEDDGYECIDIDLSVDKQNNVDFNYSIYFDKGGNATDCFVDLSVIYKYSKNILISETEFIKRIIKYRSDNKIKEYVIENVGKDGDKEYVLTINFVKNYRKNGVNVPSMAIYYVNAIKIMIAKVLNLYNDMDEKFNWFDINKIAEKRLTKRYKKKVLPAKIMLFLGIVLPILFFIIACIANNGASTALLVVAILVGIGLIVGGIVLFVRKRKYKKDIVIYGIKNKNQSIFKGSVSYFEDSKESDIENNINEMNFINGRNNLANKNINNSNNIKIDEDINYDSWKYKEAVNVIWEVLDSMQYDSEYTPKEYDYLSKNYSEKQKEKYNELLLTIKTHKLSKDDYGSPHYNEVWAPNIFYIIKYLIRGCGYENKIIINFEIVLAICEGLLAVGLFKFAYIFVKDKLYQNIYKDKKIHKEEPSHQYYGYVYLCCYIYLAMLAYKGKVDCDNKPLPYYKNGLAYAALYLSGAEYITFNEVDIEDNVLYKCSSPLAKANYDIFYKNYNLNDVSFDDLTDLILLRSLCPNAYIKAREDVVHALEMANKK